MRGKQQERERGKRISIQQRTRGKPGKHREKEQEDTERKRADLGGDGRPELGAGETKRGGRAGGCCCCGGGGEDAKP